MPAQGRWTPATGGRSSSLSIIGSFPAGGAAIGTCLRQRRAVAAGRGGADVVDRGDQEPQVGGQVGRGGAGGARQRDRVDPSGAGDPEDERHRGLVPRPECVLLRLVAEPGHAAYGQQLGLRHGAPGEPAGRRVEALGRRFDVAGELHGLHRRELGLALLAPRREVADQRRRRLRVGVHPTLAGQRAVLRGVGAGHAPGAARYGARDLALGEQGRGGDGRRHRRRGVGGTLPGDARDPVARRLQRGPDPVRVHDQETADDQRGRDQCGTRQRVGTPSGGAGAADDRGALPTLVGAVLREPLEGRPDLGGRHPAQLGELHPRVQQAALRLLERQPDLTRSLLRRRGRELGEQQRLARGDGELVERVEGRAQLGVELAVAVEDPGRVPPLRVGEHVRAYPRLRVVEPPQLRPAVPGCDEGVADRAARRGQITGQRERLDEQPITGFGVEDVELLGIGHGPATVRRRTTDPEKPDALAHPGVAARIAPDQRVMMGKP